MLEEFAHEAEEKIDDPSIETEEFEEEGLPESEEEELDETIDPESGKPWKNQAAEYRKKFQKTQEELEQLKKGQPKEKEKFDPTMQKISLNDYTDEQWEKLEDQHKMSKQAIVALHNMSVDNRKLAHEFKNSKVSSVEKEILGQVGEDIRDQVEEMVAGVGVDKSNKEAYANAVKMAVLAVKGKGVDYDTMEKKIKKKVKEQKKIVSKQSEKTPPVKKKNQANLSEEEITFARNFGISEEEYQKHK